MTRRLIVRPAAQLDIEEAAFWYESQRPGAGVQFADQLDQAVGADAEDAKLNRSTLRRCFAAANGAAEWGGEPQLLVEWDPRKAAANLR